MFKKERPAPAWFALGLVIFAFCAAMPANDARVLFTSFVFACMAGVCGYYLGADRTATTKREEPASRR